MTVKQVVLIALFSEAKNMSSHMIPSGRHDPNIERHSDRKHHRLGVQGRRTDFCL